MRAFHCLSLLLLVLACLGCPEVDPVLVCDTDDDCHEGYRCDVSYTLICLTDCSDNDDCITESQVCDTDKLVCRTKCEDSTCSDPSYICDVDNRDGPICKPTASDTSD
jgi:hypothetical protein